MLQKPELSAGLMGHLARMQTLPYLPYYFYLFIYLFFFGGGLIIGILRYITQIGKQYHMKRDLRVLAETYRNDEVCIMLHRRLTSMSHHRGRGGVVYIREFRWRVLVGPFAGLAA